MKTSIAWLGLCTMSALPLFRILFSANFRMSSAYPSWKRGYKPRAYRSHAPAESHIYAPFQPHHTVDQLVRCDSVKSLYGS